MDAWSTGIAPGAIAEFLLITANSGHDYEALFQTSAFASDIARAFAFLGVPAGRPVDFPRFRFWSAGERIEAEASVAGGAPAPLESFVMDAATKAPRAPEGLLWIGGTWDEAHATNAVDGVAGPGSIVPSYNETLSLFDVPRRAPQGEVYETRLAGTNAPAEPYAAVRIVFRPERRPAGAPPLRVRDVALRLAPDGFSIDGAAPVPPAEALKALQAMRTDLAQDPYLSFSWDGALSCADVKAAAMLLSMVDSEEHGLRVDCPPEGFPYYKAFLPPDAWRDRAKRFSQPCELRLAVPGPTTNESGQVAAAGNAAPQGTLVAITEHWKDESLTPDLTFEEISVPTPAVFAEALAEKAPPNLPALLVFVPGSLPWSALAPYLDAARATHPIVQIFVD